MGKRAWIDDVVDDELPPKLGGKVEAVNAGAAGVEGVWMNGAFWALSSCMRCCNRSFSIFNSRNVFNLGVHVARERTVI